MIFMANRIRFYSKYETQIINYLFKYSYCKSAYEIAKKNKNRVNKRLYKKALNNLIKEKQVIEKDNIYTINSNYIGFENLNNIKKDNGYKEFIIANIDELQDVAHIMFNNKDSSSRNQKADSKKMLELVHKIKNKYSKDSLPDVLSFEDVMNIDVKKLK